jgi:hypothetical protein
MNSSEILEVFREEMNDAKAPYLWSDALLFRYLNEAQEMFCRRTEGIEDSSTSEICRLAITPGQDWYPISRKILKVREAINTLTGRPYEIMNMEKASTKGVLFGGNPGPLKLFVTGLEKHKLRAWPLPNLAATVELRVFRLPLESITDECGQELEIDEQHHLAMVTWMKHRAYGKEDAETFNRRKADEHEVQFSLYCAQALKEQERARRASGTVLYGGL